MRLLTLSKLLCITLSQQLCMSLSQQIVVQVTFRNCGGGGGGPHKSDAELESLDIELSKNFKFFQFLVLFCIQNGICGLYWIFPKLALTHKI